MKVLHIATSPKGGAGIAARRIADAQSENGLDSGFLDGDLQYDNLGQSTSKLKNQKYKKIQSKALTLLQSKFLQNSDLLVTPLSINLELDSNRAFHQADILHFHAFYNLITVKRMIHLAKVRPVVVTLHDQRFFTGGCHYSFSCPEYERNCTKCPQVRSLFKSLPKIVLAESKKILTGSENLTFISPSRWLAKMAGESSLIDGYPVHVIENPVPTEIFARVKSAKKNTNRKIQLGFIAENLTNPYKGLNTLLEALSQNNLADKYELNLFGRSHGLKLEENLVVRKQTFSGAQGSADAFASIDVLIVPSLQDNFPSVVIEALVSGVPVIGSSIGGIPEVLNDFSMPTFDAGNANHLATVLSEYQGIYLDENTREEIMRRFSYKASSSSHESIYKFILG